MKPSLLDSGILVPNIGESFDSAQMLRNFFYWVKTTESLIDPDLPVPVRRLFRYGFHGNQFLFRSRAVIVCSEQADWWSAYCNTHLDGFWPVPLVGFDPTFFRLISLKLHVPITGGQIPLWWKSYDLTNYFYV